MVVRGGRGVPRRAHGRGPVASGRDARRAVRAWALVPDAERECRPRVESHRPRDSARGFRVERLRALDDGRARRAQGGRAPAAAPAYARRFTRSATPAARARRGCARRRDVRRRLRTGTRRTTARCSASGSPAAPAARRWRPAAAAAAVADAVRAATAASEAQSAIAVSEEASEEHTSEKHTSMRGERRRETPSSPSTARDAASSPSRGMAAAMSLTQKKYAGEAIRATLQIAAEAGFPDVSSEARARLRWARLTPHPDDLEHAEAYARRRPRGAVAHWNANRRALLAEAEAEASPDSRFAANESARSHSSWEVGADGVVVLGCEPTRRAWTAAIKAHCDLDEPSEAAALLREAVESEARRGAGPRVPRGGAGLSRVRGGGASASGDVNKPSDVNKHRGVERVAFNVVASRTRARAPRRAETCFGSWTPPACDRTRSPTTP